MRKQVMPLHFAHLDASFGLSSSQDHDGRGNQWKRGDHPNGICGSDKRRSTAVSYEGRSNKLDIMKFQKEIYQIFGDVCFVWEFLG